MGSSRLGLAPPPLRLLSILSARVSHVFAISRRASLCPGSLILAPISMQSCARRRCARTSSASFIPSRSVSPLSRQLAEGGNSSAKDRVFYTRRPISPGWQPKGPRGIRLQTSPPTVPHSRQASGIYRRCPEGFPGHFRSQRRRPDAGIRLRVFGTHPLLTWRCSTSCFNFSYPSAGRLCGSVRFLTVARKFEGCGKLSCSPKRRIKLPVPQRCLRKCSCELSSGAGEGNRTLVISLEGCCSTIELHPRTPTTRYDQAAIAAPQCGGPPLPCGLRRGSLRARRLACRAEAPVRARRLVGEVGLEPTKA
jgi:hypothetical protein